MGEIEAVPPEDVASPVTESTYCTVVPLTEEIINVPLYPVTATPVMAIASPTFTVPSPALSTTVTVVPDSLMETMEAVFPTRFGRVKVVRPVKPTGDELNSGANVVTTSVPLGSRLPALATKTRLKFGRIMAWVGCVPRWPTVEPIPPVAATTLSPWTSICMAEPGLNGTLSLTANMLWKLAGFGGVVVVGMTTGR